MFLEVKNLKLNHVPDVAKDTAKVAAGVGLVVAASVRRLCFRDLGSFAFQTLKGFREKRSKTGQRAGHGAGYGAQVNKNLPLCLCLLIKN
jgi:hypothetical protein